MDGGGFRIDLVWFVGVIFFPGKKNKIIRVCVHKGIRTNRKTDNYKCLS